MKPTILSKSEQLCDNDNCDHYGELMLPDNSTRNADGWEDEMWKCMYCGSKFRKVVYKKA